MRVLGRASTLPRQPLLECNEDGHADNGYDDEYCNQGVHRGMPPCDELGLQSVINYGLKFSGVVVTIIGPERGPINHTISVWPYVSKWADTRAFHGALVGDHGNSKNQLNISRRNQHVRITPQKQTFGGGKQMSAMGQKRTPCASSAKICRETLYGFGFSSCGGKTKSITRPSLRSACMASRRKAAAKLSNLARVSASFAVSAWARSSSAFARY